MPAFSCQPGGGGKVERVVQTRDTARAVLLDPDDRVLLIRILGGDLLDASEPLCRPFWVTPGGRIEEGETPEETVAREVREETSLGECSVGPLVWYGEHTLLCKGVPTRLRERFFLARTPVAGFSTAGMTQDERDVYYGHRWWRVEELRAAEEPCIPREFAALLQDLLERGPSGVRTIDLSTPH
jgi:ADP-ribose pyrophosphatase YjhB (NUDIX family)